MHLSPADFHAGVASSPPESTVLIDVRCSKVGTPAVVVCGCHPELCLYRACAFARESVYDVAECFRAFVSLRRVHVVC